MTSIARLRVISRVSLLFIFATLCGCGIFEPHESKLVRINQYLTQERSRLESSLNFAKAKSDSVWAEGDIHFYSYWLQGIDQEQKAEYAAAMILYRKALDTPRYEMSSYNVHLALGRALLLAGKRSEGTHDIKEFIKNAEAELRGDINTEWVASEETKELIKNDIKFAKWLLKQEF